MGEIDGVGLELGIGLVLDVEAEGDGEGLGETLAVGVGLGNEILNVTCGCLLFGSVTLNDLVVFLTM